MKNAKQYLVSASIVFLTAIPVIINSCGGAGVDADARSATYAALRADAEDAYNSEDYDKAIEIYNKILAENPNDEEVRTRMAFAYNAKAGLSLFDLVSAFAELTTASDNASSRLVDVMKIVGLSDSEKTSINSQLTLTLDPNITMTEFRTTVPKATTTHNSWLSLCRFIPQDLLTTLAGTDNSLASVYGINDTTKCGSGAAVTSPSSAIAISGLFALLSETAILFQVVLDKDGDGEIDIVKSMDEATTKLQTAGTVETAPSSVGEIQSSVAATAEALDSLSGFAETMAGEVFNVLFANIGAMGTLVVIAPGIPDDVVKKIRTSLARFRDQQDKITSFLKGALSNTKGLTAQRKLLATAGKKTSRGIDVLARGLGTLGQSDAQVSSTLSTVCSSLQTFVTKYGLESHVSVSTKC